MFAVIKTGGKQYKIKENDIILVEKLSNKKGDSINLNEILLLSNELPVLHFRFRRRSRRVNTLPYQ